MDQSAALTSMLSQPFAERLFAQVRALGLGVEGVNRPAYSDTETAVSAYLAAEATALGLRTFEDGARNLWICEPDETLDANGRFDLIGSHIDSVPEGGNFDGLAGVITGLLILEARARGALPKARPLRVIAMRGEESAWFGQCYLGARALMGVMTPEDLARPHKGDGASLAQHMQSQGIDTAAIAVGQPLCDPRQIARYFELHIEQGPVLVERNLPAAVVTGIRGNFRHRAIHCRGEEGHSGAVPRAYRRDPVLAMAELFMRLDQQWRERLKAGEDLVLTSGMVGTDPSRHAIARIPDQISFSLDIRSQQSEVLAAMERYIETEMERLGAERGVVFSCDAVVRSAPALMAPELVSGLLDAMRALKLEPLAMPSGAGHDAAIFAGAGIPSAMVFVRNPHGSHNPAEAMEIDDFLSASMILAHYLSQSPQSTTAAASGAGTSARLNFYPKGQTMLQSLLEVISAHGGGMHGYRAFAAAARARAKQEPEMAAAYMLLAAHAEGFIDENERMPLSQRALAAQSARLSGYMAALDRAYVEGEEGAV